MNKQNDHVVSFGQDVPEICNVSTTKHPVFIMILGVIALNGEKMSFVWFPTGYRLTAANYKDILEQWFPTFFSVGAKFQILEYVWSRMKH